MAATLTGVNVGELLQAAERQLAHIETARLDCEVLLCSVLDQDRYFLYAHADDIIEPSFIADFHSLIAKRAAGYPVAYLTGRKEFWSLPLQVTSDTLIPRPETELLVELALQLTPPASGARILELGTGSGAIAIALAAERPGCHVTATDISLPALSVARQNATRLGLNNIDFIHSDWFATTATGRHDLIVSNPPYVTSQDPGFADGEIRHEPRIALDGGLHGLEAYRRIIPAATGFLVSGGQILLEHGHQQGEAVRQLLQLARYQKIETRQDYAGLDRVTMAELP